MSSNAFARSRPRVRHQRVPRTHSCDHPRFIQLVNELARLNEIKKKQEESEGKNDCPSTDEDSSVPTASASNDNSSNLIKNCNSSSNSGSNSNSSSISGSSNTSSNCSNANGPGGSSRTINNACLNNCSGAHLNNLGACCNQIGANNPPQSSNGYRSLDNSQSTSALHDNYLHHQQQQQQQQQHHHQHQQQQNQHHQHQHHQLHHHNQHHHYNHHQLQQQQQQLLIQHEPQHLVQQQQTDRCPVKNLATNFGYTKHNLVLEQNTSGSDYSISNNINSLNNNNNNNNNNNIDSNSDLRQDENRSKRKRPSNDSTLNSRKNLSSICGSSNSNKRHKSASEAIRPLSPSFTKCPICLLDSMDRDPSFTNTCFHLFCYVCIESWTKNKATCPLCRTKFTKIIYNIKSATNYEEKVASPIRRDDDDGYIGERFIMEHLTNLNSNTTVSSRSTNSDDVQFLFENLSRNSEVLMPQYFVNQIDPRQGDLHSFNTVTNTTNFNSNVPHPPFTNTSYPMTPTNYIVGTLIPSNHRIAPMTSTAITGSYTNTSLNNINNESSLRRVSRSIRSMYSRANYEPAIVDSSGRVSRASNTTINQPGVQVERHHHNQHSHHHQSHQHHHHHPPSHRTTLDITPRHNQRLEQSHTNQLIPYTIPARHYNPPNVSYIRRPYNNPQLEYHHQHLDILYRQMPDM